MRRDPAPACARRLAPRRALALLPLALGACVLPTPLGELPSTTTTTDGSGSDGTTIGIGVSGTTSVPPTMTSGVGEPPAPLHAWAMRHDEWNASFDSGGAETSGTSGAESDTSPGIPPDTLVVQLSTGPDDCSDPHAPLECNGAWTIMLLIPPGLQTPGLYDLFADFSALATLSGDEDDGTTCSFGAGVVEGTAELFEVSEQQVTGRLTLDAPILSETTLDFVAPRC